MEGYFTTLWCTFPCKCTLPHPGHPPTPYPTTPHHPPGELREFLEVPVGLDYPEHGLVRLVEEEEEEGEAQLNIEPGPLRK